MPESISARPRTSRLVTVVRLALAAATLGLFLTLALAWAHPFAQQFLPPPKTRGPAGLWTDVAVPNKGHGGVTVTPLFTLSALWSTGGDNVYMPRQEWLDAGVPKWAATPSDLDDHARGSAYTYGYGWPARCLLYINATAPGSNFVVSSSYQPQTKTPLAYFPTTPFWPGLLTNLLVWSAVSACFIPLFSAAIRWRRARARLRRGLCPKCSYSLSGLNSAAGIIPKCPECGTPIPISRPTISA